MTKKYNVAVVGATGPVGEAMLAFLAERKFPTAKVHALGGGNATGKQVEFGDKRLKVEALEDFDFSGVEIALFCAGEAIAELYVPRAVEAGCVVIDTSACFRYEVDIPLVVPEVNPEAIGLYRNRGIIASPGAASVQMLAALKPIHDAAGIERINVCLYQAVSHGGTEGIEELATQTANLLNVKPIKPNVYPKQIAFNVLPQVGAREENGYTLEEMRMVEEVRKVLGDDAIGVNPTAVQVPVFFGHCEALHVETREKIGAEQARTLLAQAPGLSVVDDAEQGGYPTPVTESAGEDAIFVGRIREDISHPRGLDLWVVADNVRKGAALNCVQIAEILVKDHL